MTEAKVTEGEVAKLRDWVDDLRVKQPAQAPTAAQDLKPEVSVPRASLEVPEQVLRVNRLVESLHRKREVRAKLVADGNSKRVAFEAATRVDQKVEADQVAAWERELEKKIADLKADFQRKLNGRNWELGEIHEAVRKIDVSLEQLRKQLDVELGKLDPDRKVTA